MDLIVIMTYISLLAVGVVKPKIASNTSTSCNGPDVCNSPNGCNDRTNCDGHNGYNCYNTFLDIFGLPERPRTLT